MKAPATRKSSARTKRASSAVPRPRGAKPVVPVVGLGASAGGLEALELFLKHVPKGCGLAFVVVQHLDPQHKDLLVQLLQRSTAMPVIQIEDRMRVQPDRVYVLPPNRDLTILRGVLHLLEVVAPRGLHFPIDMFFRALAEDLQERSVGVILSGMGSDGTLGLQAIKEKSGAVFAQSPENAKFDAMPRNAINAGTVDVVAPAEELPIRITGYLNHIRTAPLLESRIGEHDQSALEKIIILLRARKGHDFSLYKKSSVYRRIERRMAVHQFAKIAHYVRYLQVNPQELDILFKELLIGVTSFFRDAIVWDKLRDEVLPDLIGSAARRHQFRAWVPACSTGEEAYSLAIVIKEALARAKVSGVALQIFATDLDADAIERARAGVYPRTIEADVSPERRSRYFVETKNGYRIKKEIRDTVIFAPHNIGSDPPFTKLDVVTCRNLMIYLEAEFQKKLLGLFHYSLLPEGVLVLGTAETIGKSTHLFAPLSGEKSRIYRRMESVLRPLSLDLRSSMYAAHVLEETEMPPSIKPQPSGNLQVLADQLILQHFCPSAVLATDTGDIVYFRGKTGKYLEPAVGKANLNLFAMAREGLNLELHKAFTKATEQKTPVVLSRVRVGTNGGTQWVDITIQLLTEPAAVKGLVLVVFHDLASSVAEAGAAAPRGGKTRPVTMSAARTEALEQELQRTREEMQSSQEEARSAVEELQSANEELQSTNEELTSSKEEMQSMNEELQTLNHELQCRVDELSMVSSDMNNLLNSTEIATLFLDMHLKVRRFTNPTSKIFNLLACDAGRPITDITTELIYSELVEDAQSVLKTLVFKEKIVATRSGGWFTVRIMPYRTQDNRIDGLVITFLDVTAAKKMEAELRAAEARLDAVSDAEGKNTGRGDRTA